jgi:hypothetical protein
VEGISGMTNLERIKNVDNAEEMEKAIQHAIKVSKYYTDSRQGMIKWLNETVWDPYENLLNGKVRNPYGVHNW